MQIVLHAGMHKTGTTSFQTWLRRIQPALFERGCAVFPTDPRVLVNVPVCYDPQALRSELSRLELAGIRLAVFSHETLSECFTQDLTQLVELFGAHPVRYVLTLRHWSGFLPSRWKQNCKRRDTQSFFRFFDDLCAMPEDRIEAYFSLPLQRAVQAGIENIHVTSYDTETAQNRLLEALAEACLIPCEGLLPEQSQSVQGRSGASERYDRLRLFNGLASRAAGRSGSPMAERSRTGLAPDLFYDLSGVVDAILKANPAMQCALDGLISESAEELALEGKPIADWETQVSADIATYCQGAPRSLFRDASKRPDVFSRLEVPDIPAPLKRDMEAALRSARPDLLPPGCPLTQ